ncbi:putative N-acetyltransferase [Trypanosoma vivax]|nr:putative N-acetyltransferase [Trypanosoma vivax]
MYNKNVLINGPRLRLVPYLEHHVPLYHYWMCDHHLLESTASNPLSLSEEYENQKEWLLAEDKLTFILLAPFSLGSSSVCSCEGEAINGSRKADKDAGSHLPCSCGTEGAPTGNPGGVSERYCMIGDCNLFLLHAGEEAEEPEEYRADGLVGGNSSNTEQGHSVVAKTPLGGGRCFEVEVMIAESSFRRKGLAEEAVRLLMSYALDKLEASCFVAKILRNNVASVCLFASKLGFCFLREVHVFGEVHYRKHFSALEKEAWLNASGYRVDTYDEAVERNLMVIYSPPGTISAQC